MAIAFYHFLHPLAVLFSDIIGLEDTKNALLNAINSNHVAHAQLFLGNEGSANLALALAYSRYINCEDKQPTDSCGKCTSCVQFNKLTHPDLQLVFPMANLEKVSKDEIKSHFLKQFRSFAQQQLYGNLQEWGNFVGAENKQFNINVEEGRSILQNISMKPYLSPYKIVLIWLPELMNNSMANAILKVLEEPPAQTLFLLVANDYEKLLPTILSRCQMVKIRAFTDEETERYLISKNLCDTRKAKQIAGIADGNLQKATFLSTEIEDDNHAIFATWMRLCFSKKFADLLVFCEDLGKRGRENQKGLLLYSMQILRNTLMNKAGADQLIKQDESESNFIKKFAQSINEEKVESIYRIMNESFIHIERNGNAKIVLFDTSVKISQQFSKT
ncbi:MAG: ATP-binding protein [Cytophagales bacterium]